MNDPTDISARLQKFQTMAFAQQPAPPANDAAEAAKQAHNQELLLRAGYPKRAVLAVATVAGPALGKGQALLPKILDDGIVLLLGPTGRGKTVMATWWAAQRQAKGKSCGRFMTARQMFSEIKATYSAAKKSDSERPVTEESLLASWAKTPFFVIDEIQTRTGSEWEDGALDEVINARYGAMLPTVLIANLTLLEAKKSLGPRIMDRAHECGGFVDCDWGSYRQ